VKHPSASLSINFCIDVDKSTFLCYHNSWNKNQLKKEDKKIAHILDKTDRFETFVLLIDATHKCISKIKSDIALDSKVKSVHSLWLYELMKHPEGLTASELAAKSKIDRSLVSRELTALYKGGYIQTEASGKKRGYNSRITLTDEGFSVAKSFSDAAYEIQKRVSRDIPRDELVAFYATLDKLCTSLEKLTEGIDDSATANE